MFVLWLRDHADLAVDVRCAADAYVRCFGGAATCCQVPEAEHIDVARVDSIDILPARWVTARHILVGVPDDEDKPAPSADLSHIAAAWLARKSFSRSISHKEQRSHGHS